MFTFSAVYHKPLVNELMHPSFSTDTLLMSSSNVLFGETLSVPSSSGIFERRQTFL